MNRTIFLLNGDDELVEMRESSYDSEDLLQRLLARYPTFLAGDQIDRASPRRWLLIGREVSVPGEYGGGGRWSLDHLFLDQDAIPTLVEIKRSTDTRLRREVVGQLLDYAANATAYWPADHIRSQFEAACLVSGADPEEQLLAFLGETGDPEEFWKQAKTNIQAGRIRLLFVADEIPEELRRVVEFLNQQMDPAEVLAIEIKQYLGEGVRTMVPIVVGQTAEAQQRKGSGSSSSRQWDESSFFEHLSSHRPQNEVAVARAILDWAQAKHLRIWWGKGQRTGSFIPALDLDGVSHQLFAAWSSGAVEMYFQWYAYKPPFDDESKRVDLLQRLNAIPGVSLPKDSITRRPSIPMARFAERSSLAAFLETFEWFLDTVRAS